MAVERYADTHMLSRFNYHHSWFFYSFYPLLKSPIEIIYFIISSNLPQIRYLGDTRSKSMFITRYLYFFLTD